MDVVKLWPISYLHRMQILLRRLPAELDIPNLISMYNEASFAVSSSNSLQSAEHPAASSPRLALAVELHEMCPQELIFEVMQKYAKS